MKALLLYTKYSDSLRLLAVYIEGYRFERRFKFKPVKLDKNLETVFKDLSTSPIQFGKVVEIRLDDALKGKEETFGTNLLRAIELHGDEKVILSLVSKGDK